jgi:hypothetical protein
VVGPTPVSVAQVGKRHHRLAIRERGTTSVGDGGGERGHPQPSEAPPRTLRRTYSVRSLNEPGAAREEAEDEELAEQLERLPDLSRALRDAPPEIQRRTFQAFDLQIAYDKSEGRVEVSATVSESVASAFENAKALLPEGSAVVVGNIAGAGFEPATSGL